MWRQLHDDLHRAVVIPAPPQRIVSLVPSLTELVCALGRAQNLVGVTRFCTEPAEVLAGLPRLGGTKNPDLARIAGLAPELVLVNAEENRREDFQALIALGLTIWVSFPRTVDEAARSIARLGAAIDASEPADRMAAEVVAARARQPPTRRRVFCPIWRKPWMSFNRDTYAHDVLRCAGGQNVCAEAVVRYPPVELEAVARFDPEVVLLPDEPYPFAERHRTAMRDALAPTAAGRAGRIHLIDGKALSWYGPRTAPGIDNLRALLADF
jgi:ABC-type Fe3+-hydroxamate transport system substrate-binding protein